VLRHAAEFTLGLPWAGPGGAARQDVDEQTSCVILSSPRSGRVEGRNTRARGPGP